MEKIPMNAGKNCKAEIEYPCLWQYKIIATDDSQVRELIDNHLDNDPHILTESNRSSGGKYISLNLELTLQNDAQRLRLYEVLSSHPAVKVVL